MPTLVITGASDGIGAAAAAQLAHPSRRLVLVGRSALKMAAIAERVDAEYHVADFERLEDVRALAATIADRHERIDVLANNAGGIFTGPVDTVDGFERTFQVNHLAPYLLTRLLLPQLLAAGGAVVNTASVGAKVLSRLDLDDLQSRRRFRSDRAYGNAKLGNILFTKALHARYGGRGLSAVAFHPGVVATSFASQATGYFRWLFHGGLQGLLMSAADGGANLAHFIAGRPGREWESGCYYDERRVLARTSPLADEPAIITGHWDSSAQLLGVRWPQHGQGVDV